MHNVHLLNTMVLCLKHRADRYWTVLGMLDAMGYDPLFKCHSVMGRYWKNYGDNYDDLAQAMIDDGFSWAERLKGWNPENQYSWAHTANLWSACRALRKIASQERPILLMEDDTKLLVKEEDLRIRLSTLPGDAEIAILAENWDRDPEPFNGYWTKGTFTGQSGAFCNVYTPAGAASALKCAEEHGISWENLAPHYPNDVTYCYNYEPKSLFTVHSALQHITNTGMTNPDGYIEGHEEFQGEGHHSFYDRWSNGLDVDNLEEPISV